ncbi:hypothetical protein A2G24_01075 [Listeria monocytogenes]|uniref:Uncharacterized protein n=1 Tax=Listeria monocytogenes TaxID=1639 RepID=A0A823DDL1_LISMN|nr:hypothetical protein [Listeria monocytogenes]EAD1012219.1 hypothetical protein [Listeria monocytogenes]EAD1186126.1 hypothetical protein [Listeria monocytogenes]EAF8898044.1 hypothetical protein [Listeria monocytogenes]
MNFDNFDEKIKKVAINRMIVSYSNTITVLFAGNMLCFLITVFSIISNFIWGNNFTLFFMICMIIIFILLTPFIILLIKDGLKKIGELREEK